ncbi:hypothetical protein VE03_09310 [Pseudogymnoascus sp. 23342-1-I1]|nr:hypothetical protein VE03_09310 [Pseudogymnoascus sp. 23342-1-I1]
MPRDDLLEHATSTVDFYALLGVEFESSSSDIRRAYRKTALKYHPDKLGAAFDPEKFHLLQVANDVLSDPSAKAAYDNARNARLQKVRQEQLFEGRRRQMKEELEAREKGGVGAGIPVGGKRPREEEDEMGTEIRRLAEEGKKRRREMEEKMRAQGGSTPSFAEPSVSTPPPTRPAPDTSKPAEPPKPEPAQTEAEEAEEEDEVARLERRIREIAKAKEKRRADKKARKSGVYVPADTPSASPAGDWKARLKEKGIHDKQDTSTPVKRPDLNGLKSGEKPLSSPKFSFSPKPRVVPQAKDEFAATMDRLKDAEKKRLEDEIRRKEAETPL